jgi:hypothetical protein
MKYDLHRWWLIGIAHSGTLALKKGHGFHTQWYAGETLTDALPMRVTRSVCLLFFKKKKIKNLNMNMIKETPMKNTLHIPHSFCGLGDVLNLFIQQLRSEIFSLETYQKPDTFWIFSQRIPFHQHHMR